MFMCTVQEPLLKGGFVQVGAGRAVHGCANSASISAN